MFLYPASPARRNRGNMDDTIIIDNTEFVNAPLDGGGVTYYIFSYIRGGGGWLGAILTNFLLKG